MSDTFRKVFLLTLFVVSIVLVFVGQKNVGYMGLGLEFIGMCGLIGCLWGYNSKYK